MKDEATTTGTNTLPPGPYPWIRVWGWMMGSAAYYVTEEIARAKESNAPADAIYRRYNEDGSGWDGKTWARASEIDNPTTRFVLEREYGALPERTQP